jgi:ubiquinone/menaquinone biosynthesis C-methylase UbiE
MKKDRPVPNFIAKIMYWNHSPRRLKKEMKLVNSGMIKQGQKILDIGCGTGHLSIEMARIVGESGEVYAMDIHPLAIASVNKSIRTKGIKNVKTILTSKLETGLPDCYIDIIFVINSYDMIRNKRKLHSEISRLLKSDGRLIICNRINILTSSKKIKKIFDNDYSMIYGHREKNSFFYYKISKSDK